MIESTVAIVCQFTTYFPGIGTEILPNYYQEIDEVYSSAEKALTDLDKHIAGYAYETLWFLFTQIYLII